MVVMTLAVQADGAAESTVLEIKPRTILQWEKDNPSRSAVQLGDDAWKIQYLYEIAWLTLGKQGEFSTFCATTDVAFANGTPTGTEEAEPDPTPAEAPTGS
jgi:hypothetical protein